ncbi:MAG: L-rhamnose mutarotase [Lachnospiraceae bacterium]|nr:L-rhamnose mutarotase [Lachnospiraceae bacterium]
MERNTFAIKVNKGQKQDFRNGLKEIWPALTKMLDDNKASNFSMWQIEDVVFAYYETDDKADTKELYAGIKEIFEKNKGCFGWISDPTEKMRLMYHDFGIIRKSKEQIRHRVFVTRLHEGCEEEYKARHDALVEARGGVPDPGPDSNFSIWYAGGYIMGYDEIDITMEKDETEEEHKATEQWETRMLEIMDWLTDDVDWLTGKHHDHVVMIGVH